MYETVSRQRKRKEIESIACVLHKNKRLHKPYGSIFDTTPTEMTDEKKCFVLLGNRMFRKATATEK